jgi:UDP-N-acetylmuramoyl-L-alanyl-D-glutamate--2,6-diaminopimelate ligase
MKISDLTTGTSGAVIYGDAAAEVGSVCCDSRKVQPGDLFIALKGTAADGKDYLDQAVGKGAVAAVSTDRAGLAVIADRFYGHPSGKLTLVGITGTNGKTTTVTLLYHLFKSLGYRCGLLSTIANYVDDVRSETANTTADPLTINSLLAQMVEAGCEYCFMEVSSIGIEQHRVDALDFNVGIFSNLTHDHLDYHGTFAEYLRCKKLFFDNLGKKAIAITNADDRNGLVMLQNTKARKVTYSCHSMADHTCKVMEQCIDGSQLVIDGTEVWTRLIGEHNAYNLLAIYSTAVELGLDKEKVLVALSSLSGAPGRLETIKIPDGKTVVIDYAHTPDALENVLKALRSVSPKSELVCLFGCGGDRDRTKRPEMAQVAQKYADKIIVTSDNSRSESTEAIMNEICSGFDMRGRSKSMCVASRADAIRLAINFSSKGATILLAGKGHETYQILGTEKLHFDEREVVNQIINQK